MSDFTIKPAVREQVPVWVGVVGPSGSGKTFSALRLATGIQSVSGGDIVFIDTEARRGLHYADRFRFKHVDFQAPFGSLRYLEAATYCVAQGAKTIIIDSMSHEHEGPGGLLDYQDQEFHRLGGKDSVKMLAWVKPKQARREMINGLLRLNANFITCFRAKSVTKPVKNASGKIEMVPQGFEPIAGPELVYEQTANVVLLPRSNGVPTWESDKAGEAMTMKLPEQFRAIFADRQPLSEDIGRQLAEWARGGEPVKPADPVDPLVAGRAAAKQGSAALQAWWKNITKDQAKAFKPILDTELKRIAAEADARPKEREPGIDDEDLPPPGEE